MNSIVYAHSDILAACLLFIYFLGALTHRHVSEWVRAIASLCHIWLFSQGIRDTLLNTSRCSHRRACKKQDNELHISAVFLSGDFFFGTNSHKQNFMPKNSDCKKNKMSQL